MTLILRACYLLIAGPAARLPEGPKLVAQGPMSADTYRDDDAERAGECLYPGDFADWKPRAEVMLRGTCHTPSGKPLPECPVRFSVGILVQDAPRRRPPLLVRRPRRRRHVRASRPSRRCPSTTPTPSGGRAMRRTPPAWGLRWSAPRAAQRRARRHDPPGARRSRARRLRAHQPRVAAARRQGGQDSTAPRWKKERSPYYAEDFDWTHFNAAPPTSSSTATCAATSVSSSRTCTPPSRSSRPPCRALRIRAFVKDVKAALPRGGDEPRHALRRSRRSASSTSRGAGSTRSRPTT
jgi:hypothetical protein